MVLDSGCQRAGCFSKFVFLVSCNGCLALPRDAMGLVCLRFVIVLFPDHTHYFQKNVHSSGNVWYSI